MSIDLSWLDDNDHETVMRLSGDLYSTLATVLSALEQKTSLFIDPYGTTRISPTHSATLRELVLARSELNSPEVKALCDLLQSACKDNRWILVEGD